MIAREEALRLRRDEKRAFGPWHPGTYLQEELLEPLEMSQSALARRLGTMPHTVNEICRGRCSVTTDTPLRLGRFFDMTLGSG